jgi:REP element-mobilizing transposase RayT
MARLPRLNLPDIPQHVIQRGNNRQPCFFSDQDYAVYLGKLREYSEQFKVSIHAYVLMTDFCSCKICIHPVHGNNKPCSLACYTRSRRRR